MAIGTIAFNIEILLNIGGVTSHTRVTIAVQ